MALEGRSLEFLAVAQIWQLTVVILAVALLVRLAGPQRAHLAHLLWMLVLVKALTPPLLATPWSLYEVVRLPQTWGPKIALETAPLAPRREISIGPALEPIDERDGMDSAPAVATAKELGPRRPADVAQTTDSERHSAAHAPRNKRLVRAAVAIVWLCGAACTAVFSLLKLAWFYHAVRRAAVPTEPRLQALVERLRRQLRIRRPVTLIVSRQPFVPTAFGFLRARIVISEALVHSASAEQLQMTLAHELVHIRRGDLYSGVLQVVAQIVWWYHPLVWWVNEQATHAIERCCDQEVLCGTPWQPASYARCLLELARFHRTARRAPILPAMRPVEVTRRRLEGIVRRRRFHRKTPWQYWAVTVVVGLFVLPSTSSRATRPSDDDSRSRLVRDAAARQVAEASRHLESLNDLQRPAPRVGETGFPALLAGPVFGAARLTHWNVATPLGFLPGGDLVSSSADGTLAYWHVNTGKQLHRIDLPRFNKHGAWWRLPPDKQHALHSAAVLSANGRRLFLGRADGTIYVYDTGNRRLVDRLQVPGGCVAGFSLSPDANWLAARRLLRGELEPTVVVLNARTGEVVAGIAASASAGGQVENCAAAAPQRQNSTWSQVVLSASGELLAAAYHEYVTLWDVATGRLLHTFEHREDDKSFTVAALTFSPDGQTLATGGAGGLVRLWNVSTGQPRLSLPHRRSTVRAVAFDPSGEFLATAGRQIHLWRAASGAPVWAAAASRSVAHQRSGLVFNAAGSLLAAGAGRRLLIIETSSGRVLSAGTSDTEHSFECLAVSTGSEQFVCGNRAGELTIWDYRQGQVAATWPAHRTAVTQVAYSRDGQSICSSGEAGGSLVLWDAVTGDRRRTLDPRVGGRSRMAFSPDNKSLVTASSGRDPVKLWDVGSGQLRRTLQLEPRTSPFMLAWGPDANTLFDHSRQQLIQWDLDEIRAVQHFTVDTRWGGQRRYAVSPDGTRVAGGVVAGRIIIWDLAAGGRRELLQGHTNRYLRALTFSRDGQWLASAAEDGKVQIWDARSGQPVRTIRIGPRAGIIDQLAFSTADQYLITVNGNGTVYVLDLAIR